MGVALDYRKKIIDLTKELPSNRLKELADFAQFLKVKKEVSSYLQIKDSAGYVRHLRVKESKRVKTGKRFIEELVEWQKSNS